MKKVIKIAGIFALLAITLGFYSQAFADTSGDISTLKSGMSNTVTIPGDAKNDSGLGKVINIAIGLIQVAGTGISLIVITICGIKYMIASAQEKADLKKQVTPIVIGCVLLFAGSNIIGIIANLAEKANLT